LYDLRFTVYLGKRANAATAHVAQALEWCFARACKAYQRAALSEVPGHDAQPVCEYATWREKAPPTSGLLAPPLACPSVAQRYGGGVAALSDLSARPGAAATLRSGAVNGTTFFALNNATAAIALTTLEVGFVD
jgi:hypothetical protein